MSKRVRTLILSLVAVVVLVGALLLLLFVLPKKGDSSSSADSSDTSITVYDKTANSSGVTVSKMSIKNTNEQFTLSPNADGQLVVESYMDLPINTSEIQTLSLDVLSLTATKKIADSADDPSLYGFDSPQAVIDATFSDGSSVTITMGSLSPLKEGYYTQVKGDNTVYLVGKSYGDEFVQSSLKYIGKSVITAPSADSSSTSDQAVVRSMNLYGTVRASKPFAFREHQDTDRSDLDNFDYVITSPYVTGLNSDTMSTVTSTTSLTAADVVKAHPAAADLKTYGLDNPYSVCEMTLAVQSTSTDSSSSGSSTASSSSSKVKTYYNDAKHIVKLGGKDSDGNYYALIDNYNVVYTVSSTAVPWAETKYSDAANRMLFTTNIANVSSISVNSEGKNTVFSLTQNPNETDNDKKLTVTVEGTTYPTSDFRLLYQVFMGVNRYGDTDKKPSGDPVVTFTMNMSDSSTFVARFYKLDANLYLCAIDGGESYTVKVSDVEKMQTQLKNYLNGQSVEN